MADCRRVATSVRPDARHERVMWAAVAALTLLGIVLRILAARGALWLDEAWSATFAEQAATPIGVIWRVNHDNNHILNTLWLQWVGSGASPLIQRALSIVTGTAAVPLAAAFAARRGAAAGLIAALAFAVSPMLVTYGSEARGYAPMVAAFLAILVLVDRWLERNARVPVIGLAMLALLGTLAQVLMIASLLAITAWSGLVLWRRRGFGPAMLMVSRNLGPALVASALVLVVMLLAADTAPAGFTIGSYAPFSAADWTNGVAGATAWTLGIEPAGRWIAVFGCAAALALLAAQHRDPRATLYAILILGLPLAYALLRVGNVSYPRYYLPAAVCLLLIAADALGRARAAGIALVALFAIGSARLDVRLIADRRANPAVAIAAMRAAAPTGTTLILPDARMTPVFRWAARAAHYPMRIVGTRCAPAPFLLLDDRSAATLRLCCGTYRLVAARRAEGLSGTGWRLYRRVAP